MKSKSIKICFGILKDVWLVSAGFFFGRGMLGGLLILVVIGAIALAIIEETILLPAVIRKKYRK